MDASDTPILSPRDPLLYHWIDMKYERRPIHELNGVVVIHFDVRQIAFDDMFGLSDFSTEELNRASRFHFEINRREYLAARGIVRSYLAQLVGVRPAAIILEAELNKKPRLLNDECCGIDFSISHSGGYVACAFVRDNHIGVDIENRDQHRNIDLIPIARRMFSRAEREVIENDVAALDYRHEFLRIWTRKEAVLKAAGVGLSAETRSFDVLRLSPTGVESVSPISFADQLWNCDTWSTAGFELSVAWSNGMVRADG